MNLNRTALRRAGCLGAAALLALTLGAVGPTSQGSALGQVVAITPYEVTPFLEDAIGSMSNPSLSGRGEVAGAYDSQMTNNVWTFLDSPGPEPMFDGLGITISGDGCAAVYVVPPPIIIGLVQVPTFQFRIARRCPAFEDREIFSFQGFYDGLSTLALSHDGRFAVLGLPPVGGVGARVVRVDTNTGATVDMPIPGGYSFLTTRLGADISDDGNVVVATALAFTNTATAQLPPTIDVAAWDVPSGGVGIVSSPSNRLPAAYPSVSGNGRFVSFAAREALVGGESGPGPWVYVADRSNGALSRVSGAGDVSYHSSITRDGSQVAYTVSRPGCPQGQDPNFIDVENICPGLRIDVAYGPNPGLSGPFSVETISILANGGQGGLHVEPALSGNGQYVAWISNAGGPLLGSTDPALNGRHAFVRRRDPALAVSGLDFGTILVNTSSAPLPTTVTNTGRTSISLDNINAGGRFQVVGGGSCVGGTFLPPGASCTVNVRFNAPNTEGVSNGTISVSENGFMPVSASNTLIGRASVAPPPTTTTTTTTTVPTGPTTTRPNRPGQTTTTTTTTVPGVIEFVADPNPVDYGQVAVGIASPIQTVTISNTGTVGGQLLTELLGDNPDDFFVARNGCDAVTLAPGQSCTLDIMMIPLAGGLRKASLVITLGGVSGEVELSGIGHFAPQLLASPGAITTNGITTIIGRGFPPGGTFDVHIDPTGIVIPATADALGMFRIPFSAFRTLELGNYVLRVDPLPDVFELVRGQLVVVLPTFEPQGPNGPAFGPEALIVTRGK